MKSFTRSDLWSRILLILAIGALLSACAPSHPALFVLAPTQGVAQEQMPAATAVPPVNTAAVPLSTETADPQPVLVTGTAPDTVFATSQASTFTSTATPFPTLAVTDTPDTRPVAKYWRTWPIVPNLTGRARQVFLLGQQMGNDAHSFTRIGDCQSVPNVFLGIYGTSRYYFDPDFKYLQQTVDWFANSFSMESMAAKDGFGVASVFSPLMSNPEQCNPSETPLECEFRLHKPAFAFIAMGTNWAPNASLSFEKYLRQMVDYSTEHGVVPVLVTKADNIEQDNALNESIAKIAYEKDVPLYNAWARIQYLPNHGLKEDHIYLTPDAWDARSFGALQTLDTMLRDLGLLQPATTTPTPAP